MHIELIHTDNLPAGAAQMATLLFGNTADCADDIECIMELTGVRLRHSPFVPERVKQSLS